MQADQQIPTEKKQDVTYLRDDQYRDASNLNARVRLHVLYSTNLTRWPVWVFDQLSLKSGMRVLECGCGPGWLWRENLDRIPADCQVTLTDFSSGMIAESKAALAGTKLDFAFREADITALPFPDDSFDVVVANHMLYHVVDRPKALNVVRRVLADNGRFYAATNGKDHLRELRQLYQRFMPEIPGATSFFDTSFSLENGRSQLETTFPTVKLLTYPDSLEVTEVQPLLDYILSSSEMRATLSSAALVKIEDYVNQTIRQRGAFHITKSSGLFVAS